VTLARLGNSPLRADQPQRDATIPAARQLGPFLAALAVIGLLVPLDRSWAAQVLLVPLLLVVPGAILLRALRIPGRAVSSVPVYVPAASLVVLLAVGIAVDVIGLLLGVAAPLRAGPLLVGFELICAALLACSAGAPPETDIPWRSLFQPARLAWPLILPLVAAAGALRLNSGHGHGVAVIAVVAIVGVLVWAVLAAPRLDKTLLAVVLFAAGLALMWSFSLRGDLVYGFDISAEYYALHHTVLTGAWHPAHPGDAYGALLSLTVLPAELHSLSGVPDLLVFKVVYPAIGALLPVGVFSLARPILTRRWAFVAGAFLLTQAPFLQELPAIARQEISLVLFVALIAAMLDTRSSRRAQWTLVVLLSLGMAVSHYSTTYLTVIVLGLAVLFQWGISWFRAVPRVTGSIALAFAVPLAGGVLWYGPVTHSSSNVTQFATAALADGFNLLPTRVQGESLLSSYLQGNGQATIPAARYAQDVHSYYRLHRTFVTPLPDASSPQYALRDSAVAEPPVRLAPLHSLLNLGALAAQQLANLLGAIGALMMALRRRAPVIVRQVGLLGVAALLFLTAIRLSGTLASAYNPERALLQGQVLLGITLCWPLRGLASRQRRRERQERPRWWGAGVLALTIASLVVIVAGTSGLAGAFLGGGTPGNLANSGEDFERYYVTAPELTSATWLGQAMRPGQFVYADRYAGLRLIAMTGLVQGVFSDVTPMTISQNGWVYASRANTVDRQARALYDNQFASYVFPYRFLDANYDTVFTDGSSEVFYR